MSQFNCELELELNGPHLQIAVGSSQDAVRGRMWSHDLPSGPLPADPRLVRVHGGFEIQYQIVKRRQNSKPTKVFMLLLVHSTTTQ